MYDFQGYIFLIIVVFYSILWCYRSKSFRHTSCICKWSYLPQTVKLTHACSASERLPIHSSRFLASSLSQSFGSRLTLSQFRRLEIRRSTSFIEYRNIVDRRILRFQNCKKLGRAVVSSFLFYHNQMYSHHISSRVWLHDRTFQSFRVRWSTNFMNLRYIDGRIWRLWKCERFDRFITGS